jgi:hypothetical protein
MEEKIEETSPIIEKPESAEKVENLHRIFLELKSFIKKNNLFRGDYLEDSKRTEEEMGKILTKIEPVLEDVKASTVFSIAGVRSALEKSKEFIRYGIENIANIRLALQGNEPNYASFGDEFNKLEEDTIKEIEDCEIVFERELNK